jgi:hypothetical protein
MKTRGQEIAEAVRVWLFTNGLKQSQLTGAVLAEIADRTLAALEKADAKRKRLATEDEWLDAMQKDPAMVGVDVRMALSDAQFYCRNNSRICTRKFFSNWLLNPKNRRILNGGGAKPKVNGNGHAPAGWLAMLNALYPDTVYAKGAALEIERETDYEWGQLNEAMREKIRKAL